MVVIWNWNYFNTNKRSTKTKRKRKERKPLQCTFAPARTSRDIHSHRPRTKSYSTVIYFTLLTKARRMMKRGNSIFIGCVNIGSRAQEQLRQS